MSIRHLLTLTLVFLCAIATGAAQPPTEATVAAATARLQAQDPAGAARILEAVTAREPGNARAWRVLGTWSGIHGFHSGRMFIVSSGIRTRASNPSR